MRESEREKESELGSTVRREHKMKYVYVAVACTCMSLYVYNSGMYQCGCINARRMHVDDFQNLDSMRTYRKVCT